MDRLQSLLDSSLHGSDGSSHRGRRPGRSASLDDAREAAPGLSKPASGFRFDFGGWEVGAAAAAKRQAAGAGAAAAGGGKEGDNAPAAGPRFGHAAWPGLTVGVPPSLAPNPRLGPGGPVLANGTVRAGGHFDKRMHGASLYRNMLVNPGAGPAHLETVKE